jgi:hypothetical protein
MMEMKQEVVRIERAGRVDNFMNRLVENLWLNSLKVLPA